jgi:hypothetical protein
MAEIRYFPGVVAEEVLRQREDKLADVKVILGDIDALTEALRGLNEGNWRAARNYVLVELEFRHAMLRQILGAE